MMNTTKIPITTLILLIVSFILSIVSIFTPWWIKVENGVSINYYLYFIDHQYSLGITIPTIILIITSICLIMIGIILNYKLLNCKSMVWWSNLSIISLVTLIFILSSLIYYAVSIRSGHHHHNHNNNHRNDDPSTGYIISTCNLLIMSIVLVSTLEFKKEYCTFKIDWKSTSSIKLYISMACLLFIVILSIVSISSPWYYRYNISNPTKMSSFTYWFNIIVYNDLKNNSENLILIPDKLLETTIPTLIFLICSLIMSFITLMISIVYTMMNRDLVYLYSSLMMMIVSSVSSMISIVFFPSTYVTNSCIYHSNQHKDECSLFGDDGVHKFGLAYGYYFAITFTTLSIVSSFLILYNTIDQKKKILNGFNQIVDDNIINPLEYSNSN